jgi:simple sugar transport system ATP-binding protein
MRALGLAHVPEDRLRQGMVAAFEASGTSILGYQDSPPFTRHYLLDRPAVAAHCARLMELFDVRPRSPGLRSSSFSGGNQQKLVLAREIARKPKVLLVGQPTRGVDVGAIEFIRRELVKARDAGCAVLVVSVELDEILSLADRILVMFAGRIAGEVEPGRADERTLGLMMAGADAA